MRLKHFVEAWKVLARDAEILELVGIKNLIPLRSYSEESSRASTFELQKKGVIKVEMSNMLEREPFLIFP